MHRLSGKTIQAAAKHQADLSFVIPIIMYFELLPPEEIQKVASLDIQKVTTQRLVEKLRSKYNIPSTLQTFTRMEIAYPSINEGISGTDSIYAHESFHNVLRSNLIAYTILGKEI